MGKLAELLNTKKIILLDGAMGTELQKRGCDISLPLWSAKPLMDRPDVVRHIHIDYIDCGADIITTNTFRTQRRTFEKANYQPEGKTYAETAKELSKTAVDLAQDAVMIASDENEPLVAGCISPLEDCYSPELVPDMDTLCTEHYEHIQNLVDAGCDMLLAETMISLREISAVVNQIHKFEIDYAISITPKNDKELLSGETISDAVKVIEKYSPQAILVNCIHPAKVEPVLIHLKSLTEIPLGAYANTGDPFEKENPKPPVTPDEYLNYAKRWKQLGARILGGCCGTNPMYILKMRGLR
ncbi:MAG TPA: homocysteine S-methyltransferase family protein [Ignavibacteria bacterium]|nr:homocysteine S-methyltransferase family protein [Ignavibacteria bacterium]